MDKSEKKKKKEPSHRDYSLSFSRKNYVTFAIALFIIIIGWLLLGKGSMNLAPVLLVVGYLILIPLAILWGSGSIKRRNGSEEESE
jgi:uncharacterized membrane protein